MVGETCISAKTRSWSVAEKKTQGIRDTWDPVKKKLKELADREEAEEADVVSLEHAVDRCFATIKSKSENETTLSKYKTLCGHLKSYLPLVCFALPEVRANLVVELVDICRVYAAADGSETRLQSDSVRVRFAGAS